MAELLEYVRAMEKLDSRGRGDFVLEELRDMGVRPRIQANPFPRVRNIIVDPPAGSTPRLLFSAHYDRVKGSPGANDDASGVAVLLGLCHLLGEDRRGVRVVFFDREEAWLRTPFLKLGLLGSLCYACRNNLRGLRAVYNLEYAGLGDTLAIWPVKSKQIELETVVRARSAAGKLGTESVTAHVPWLLLSSDHLPFRLKGFANAVTLSLLPSAEVSVLRDFAGNLSVGKLLTRGRPRLPEPLSRIHTARDTSNRLSEASLQLMLRVVEEIARG